MYTFATGNTLCCVLKLYMYYAYCTEETCFLVFFRITKKSRRNVFSLLIVESGSRTIERIASLQRVNAIGNIINPVVTVMKINGEVCLFKHQHRKTFFNYGCK